MNRLSFGCPGACRNFVNFCLEDPAAVGKEQNIVVGVGRSEVSQEIILIDVGTYQTLAAATLCFERSGREALDVAGLRQSDDCFLLRDQVFLPKFLKAARDYF